MLYSAFCLALSVIPALALPIGVSSDLSRRSDSHDQPLWAYESTWYLTLSDAKQFTNANAWSGQAQQVESAAEEFAQVGHQMLEGRGVETSFSGAWDSDFISVVDDFSGLSEYEVYYLNTYIVKMNHLMGKADYIGPITADPDYEAWLDEYKSKHSLHRRQILSKPLWKYESIFYVAIFDAVQHIDNGSIHGGAAESLINVSEEFSSQGAKFLEAKGVELNMGGGWAADFYTVMDHFWNLNESEVSMLNGYAEAMFDDMGEQIPQ
ncbi:hypothetical protein FRB96_009645 [Tulasnella sp. 330]|nr:hypothetical protein FRB96_009645 [Tulasnella sp. 330]